MSHSIQGTVTRFPLARESDDSPRESRTTRGLSSDFGANILAVTVVV
jgi:hypothetical protein